MSMTLLQSVRSMVNFSIWFVGMGTMRSTTTAAHLSNTLEHVTRWREEKKKREADVFLQMQKKRSNKEQNTCCNPMLHPLQQKKSLLHNRNNHLW